MAGDRDCIGEVEQVKANDDLIHQAYQEHLNDHIAMGRRVIELHQPLGNAELEQIWKTKFELQFGVSRTLFMAIAREVMHPTIGGLKSDD